MVLVEQQQKCYIEIRQRRCKSHCRRPGSSSRTLMDTILAIVLFTIVIILRNDCNNNVDSASTSTDHHQHDYDNDNNSLLFNKNFKSLQCFIQPVLAFQSLKVVTVVPIGINTNSYYHYRQRQQVQLHNNQYQQPNQFILHVLAAKKKSKRKNDNDDNDDDDINKDSSNITNDVAEAAMDGAFRLLDELQSLEDENDNSSSSTNIGKVQVSTVTIDDEIVKELSKSIKNNNDDEADTTITTTTTTTNNLLLEKELTSYTKLVDELEKNEEAEAYKEMMNELGGSIQSSSSSLLTGTVADTYTEIMNDLGGTPKFTSTKTKSTNTNEIIKEISISNPIITTKTPEELLDVAIQQAVAEAVTIQINNKSTIGLDDTSTIVSSILDDTTTTNDDDDDDDIRNELRAILDEGNAKLIENLNAIRLEQEALAKESAERFATTKVDEIEQNDKRTKERMVNAEQTMNKMLQVIDTEVANVAAASKALQDANTELDNDPLVRLKRGGIPKQLTFIGLLLFSFRSIIDTTAAVIAINSSNGSESDISTGLIEGAIAIVCAILSAII